MRRQHNEVPLSDTADPLVPAVDVPVVVASRGTHKPVDRSIPQPWLIRLTHWVNVPLMIIMAMSGLQILVAYPFLGPHGAPFHWWPLQGLVPPAWLRIGEWLGGSRAFHFAFSWFFVINGVVYLSYYLARGEWRRRAFLPKRDAAHAVRTALFYARLAKEPPSVGLYNGLQRLGYTSAIVLGIIEVLSGLAIWKPVQLHWLCAMFFGYDGARSVHLFGLIALALFVIGHVIMVALHPRTMIDMITGGRIR